MIRVDIEDLRKLNNINELAEIFSRRLNYEYVDTPVSTRHWKEGIAKSIVNNDIKLLAKHQDFHIIYCKLIKLLLGLERPIINQLLKEYPYLLVIFSDSNHKNWHFVNIKYDDEVKNRRLFRRIVIGPDERLHTAAQRINMLEVTDEMISPLELQIKHDKAFDVEEVTKDFYKKYTEIFHMLSEDIAEENPWEDTYKEAQIILDRLIFLYFIQKKGWLNNNKRYLYENFLKFWKKDPKDNSFYSDFLVKLFQDLSFQGSLYKESLGNIPFLNGGLFEVDPFHSKLPFHIVIKNNTFKQIFNDLLEHFNFTVREDTPLDLEVAIDPEMLGKIFENLILRLEKGEDLRKKTGSYYTPRVIVHFMCQQSLKEYLVNESEIDRSKIESLFTMSPADQLSEEELRKLKSLISIPQARLLKSLIKKINILDPAVGSGAFLVSMLHKMLSIIKLLDIREFGQEYILRVNYDYELKRQLIETCLYGVDIQEQAVRICELRLWLSLIVDYEKIEGEDVPSLPNLSYRIRCGDSLIEKLFGHCVQLDQLVKTDKGRQLIDEISRNKEVYFLARDVQEKNRIELSTLVKQCELMELLIKEKQKSLTGPQLSFLKESAKERKKREEFEKVKKEYENVLLSASNTRKKVEAMLKGKISIPAEDIHNLKKKLGISFIWRLDFAEVFKEKDGFDVVIQNPPYINVFEMKQQPNLYPKDEYRRRFSCAVGAFDLYVLFHELSVKLLHKQGISCIICPNKYLSAEYSEALRKWLNDNVVILSICDVSLAKPFDAAVYPIISIYRKETYQSSKIDNQKLLLFRSVGKTQNEMYIKLFASLSYKLIHLTEDLNWSLILQRGTEIINKIFSDSVPLKKVCAIFEAATVAEAYKFKKIVFDSSAISDPTKNYVPLIVSGNIRRYYITWSFKKTRYIKKSYFRPLLKINAAQVSDTRRKQIKKRKVILSGMSKRPKAFYDDKGVAGAIPTVILLDAICDLPFLCGLLNSKLYALIYRSLFGSLALSGGYLRFGPPQIKKLPVKIPDRDFQDQISELVLRIQKTYENNVFPLPERRLNEIKTLEEQIDQKVYKLYCLTDEEIALVEENAQ